MWAALLVLTSGCLAPLAAQAQGVWRMLQGKPKDEQAAAEQARHEAERKRTEDAQVCSFPRNLHKVQK